MYVWLAVCSKIGVGAKIRVFWSHGEVVECLLSAAKISAGNSERDGVCRKKARGGLRVTVGRWGRVL